MLSIVSADARWLRQRRCTGTRMGGRIMPFVSLEREYCYEVVFNVVDRRRRVLATERREAKQP